MKERRYSWLPDFVRVVDFADRVIVRYKGKEIEYSKTASEEQLKKDILEGKLEALVKKG